jgi:tetratricopeptide (TPR) repeat protein
MALHRPVVAMSDIDAALALDPGDVDALIARAILRRNGGDETGALADIDAVAKSLPPQAVQRLDLGAFYLGLDRFDAAVDQFDLWIRYHPEDARLGAALNGRCWARALAGEALDRALSDCNRAVGLYPNSAEVRDGRGLVRLRRGEYDRAIADYDAALKLAPKLAWSLYGRGLAELKTGSVEAGRADIAAGEALAPRLAEQARKLGIVPDPGSAKPAPTPPAREAVPTPPAAPGTRPPA